MGVRSGGLLVERIIEYSAPPGLKIGTWSGGLFGGLDLALPVFGGRVLLRC
jgi:hypothetical protein